MSSPAQEGYPREATDAPVKPEHDWEEWQLLNFSPLPAIILDIFSLPAIIPDVHLSLSLPDLIG